MIKCQRISKGKGAFKYTLGEDNIKNINQVGHTPCFMRTYLADIILTLEAIELEIEKTPGKWVDWTG